jgi:ketosteroid isomerase-like protein
VGIKSRGSNYCDDKEVTMSDFNKIIDWYENISPDSLGDIPNYYTRDAYFKDPFNEFNGIDKIKAVFDHMFKELENPRFIFKDKVINGEEAFLTWDFIFSMRGKEHKIHGGSLLRLDEKGKISYHRDYWDTGEELFTKIPILKTVFNFIKKKMAV